MMVLLDQMGKRYGKLPSKILEEASTMDVVIMDFAMTFEAQQMKGKDHIPDMSTDKLTEILEQARGN